MLDLAHKALIPEGSLFDHLGDVIEALGACICEAVLEVGQDLFSPSEEGFSEAFEFGDGGACERIGESGEGFGSAMRSFGSVEAMECFFGVVDFGEDGVLFEPMFEAKPEGAL